MPRATDYRSGRHVVFSLTTHLAFVPKYRRKVITERVLNVLRASGAIVCRDFEAEFREAAYEDDHVHLLIAYPPKVALSTLTNSLKGVSAPRMRAAGFPDVER